MRFVALYTTIVSILASFLPLSLPYQQSNPICFPDDPGVSQCINQSFTSYWGSNGGLPIFGYPITDAALLPQADLDGEYLTQWFERTRLEVHPENPQPYTVLLGRLGADRLAQLGRNPLLEPRENGPIDGCLWFEQTGRNVCNQSANQGFKKYWEEHGLKIDGLDPYQQSLQLFGLPLTSVQLETNSSGHTVLTQWFERARFEWYPDLEETYQVQLGLLGNELAGITPVPSMVGAQIQRGYAQTILNSLDTSQFTWIRTDALRWSIVEETKGARNWQGIESLTEEYRHLSSKGHRVIGVIESTPVWAREHTDKSCSRIKSADIPAFAAFVADVVTRYSQAPYNVMHWEIWNEPDIAPNEAPENAVFGCWGDQSDPYYGGGYYAEVMKQVYPAIKQANPNVSVIFGGLLLDCNPNSPPRNSTCAPAKFFEGALRNGAGKYFDILSVHGYSYWNNRNEDWDKSQEKWSSSGGVIIGKTTFLREVMSRYNISKPIFLTETALLCSNNCNFELYNPAQANHIVRLYTRGKAHGLLGVLWFTLDGPGWRNSGLLDANQQPRPAYHSLNFLSKYISNTVNAGGFTQGTLEGYTFSSGTMLYHVVWSNNTTEQLLPLPLGTQAAFDIYGNPVQYTPEGIVVGYTPILIEAKAQNEYFPPILRE